MNGLMSFFIPNNLQGILDFDCVIHRLKIEHAPKTYVLHMPSYGDTLWEYYEKFRRRDVTEKEEGQ